METNEFLLTENDEEMEIDLVKSTSSLKKEIEKLEIKMFLSGKFDRNNAIITLHPGARTELNHKIGHKCFIECIQDGQVTMVIL